MCCDLKLTITNEGAYFPGTVSCTIHGESKLNTVFNVQEKKPETASFKMLV